ncbi:MAG: amidohydrolase [Paracoccaceae bacterium]
MKIDAHHHLWDLQAVHYPWLMATGVERFFGDPTSIQRDYLFSEFRAEAAASGFGASVHIQVGAADGWAEAQYVQAVADANPDWSLKQVVFCDLTADDAEAQLDRYQTLSTVVGVRQLVARAPWEEVDGGTEQLLANDRFSARLLELGSRGLSFDLQLTPEVMLHMAEILYDTPGTPIALCHMGSPHTQVHGGVEGWAEALTSLSRLDHVTCKLSGLAMFRQGWTHPDTAQIVSTCLEQFGADRCMFGSNFPVDKIYSAYPDAVEAVRAAVPEADHDAVFGGVAAKFYGFT